MLDCWLVQVSSADSYKGPSLILKSESVVFCLSTTAKKTSVFLVSCFIFFLYELPDTMHMVCQMCSHAIFHPNTYTRDFWHLITFWCAPMLWGNRCFGLVPSQQLSILRKSDNGCFHLAQKPQ